MNNLEIAKLAGQVVALSRLDRIIGKARIVIETGAHLERPHVVFVDPVEAQKVLDGTRWRFAGSHTVAPGKLGFRFSQTVEGVDVSFVIAERTPSRLQVNLEHA